MADNWIYFLDALVGIALVGAGIGRWRWLRQRAAEGRGKRPGAGVVIRLALAAFLLLHVWAQFRPVPVLVETTRLMSEAEKAQVVYVNKSGFTMEMLRDMPFAECKPFNGSNALNWSWLEIRKLQRLLAWGAILPRLPRTIVIRDGGFPMAEANYSQVGSRQKHIDFFNDDREWKIGRPYFISYSLASAQTFWDQVFAQVRIVLWIY